MRLTTQAQRPGARDATIANRDAMPGSLQRMVRPLNVVNHNLSPTSVEPTRTVHKYKSVPRALSKLRNQD